MALLTGRGRDERRWYDRCLVRAIEVCCETGIARLVVALWCCDSRQSSFVTNWMQLTRRELHGWCVPCVCVSLLPRCLERVIIVAFVVFICMVGWWWREQAAVGLGELRSPAVRNRLFFSAHFPTVGCPVAVSKDLLLTSPLQSRTAV